MPRLIAVTDHLRPLPIEAVMNGTGLFGPGKLALNPPPISGRPFLHLGDVAVVGISPVGRRTGCALITKNGPRFAQSP